MSALPPDLRFVRHRTNGITLHCAEAGSADGRLVFLLHGFPEFWYGWRNQLAPLAAAGHFVVVPDQRGYGASDKPEGIAAYDLDCLTADVAGLADTYGRKTFSIVGHDWGGAVGWWTAAYHPDRVQRFAALNAPHPAVWKDAMRNNPAQRRLSRYVRIIAIPGLVEFMLRMSDCKGLVDALRQSRSADAFSAAELSRYRDSWKQPGALNSMLNWYRAILRKPLPLENQRRLSSPTCLIWGQQDAFAVPELAELSVALCNHGAVIRLNEATHWVQHDEPERVNAILLEFLK